MNKIFLLLFLATLSTPSYSQGNSIASAILISVNSAVTGNIRTSNDRDYFKIHIQQTQSITIITTGNLDTYGYILNSDGVNIAFNDDGGSAFNFTITKILSPGIYYIKVQAYNLDNVGSYFLRVISSIDSSSPDKNTLFHGNSILSATSVNLSSETPASIATGNDYDYFKISITKPGTVIIRTTGSLDTFGYLLDSNGLAITFNDDGDDSNFKITRTLEAGIYYIKAQAYTLGDRGNYSLLVSFSDTPDAPKTDTPTIDDNTNTPTTPNNPNTNTPTDDYSNDITTATSIATSSTTSARIEVAGDIDYFKIPITNAGTITIKTTGSLDTIGNLLNSDGSSLIADDDSGSGSNFALTQEVSAGIHYIKVNAYGSNTGSYSLIISFVNSALGNGGGTESNDISSAIPTSTSNSTSYAEIKSSYDIDFYKIVVQRPGTLHIQTKGQIDTFGYLLRENGTSIAVNDDDGDSSNFKITKSVSAGNYIIKVKGYSSIDTGRYSLIVNFVVN